VPLVVDASVALKWVLEEDGAAEAIALVDSEILLAPDLLFVECANVLGRRVRRGEISAEAAREAQAAIEAVPIRVVPIKAHAATALTAALELQQSAYDCLYLMCAVAERSVMVTADAVFARAVQSHPTWGRAVRLLV
jgi:predicted nucleic acid-binding protein